MTGTTGVAGTPAFEFGLSSCQYPAGMLDARVAWRSLMAMDRIPPFDPVNKGPIQGFMEFFIFAGDRIYADATAGIFDPGRLDLTLEDGYHSLQKSTGWNRMTKRAHTGIGMLDDHEIGDNWEPLPRFAPGERANLRLMRQASRAYAAAATKDERDWRRAGDGTARRLWYQVPPSNNGGHRFFIADTRTMRTLRNTSTANSARIMRKAQWHALRDWLGGAKSAKGLSFIVSPSMLLPRRLASREPLGSLKSDAWCGYPASLHDVLAAVHATGCNRIVFLSGDEHTSCVARITIERDGARVESHSIHSSALYAPFPFANGHAEEFARAETFAFDPPDGQGGRFTCTVRSAFVPGDGFAVISAQHAGNDDPAAASSERREVALAAKFYRPTFANEADVPLHPETTWQATLAD